MTYLRLFWEFFKTGLFAVGGGMATVPFLKNIGLATGWYSQTDLMNMLAVSESTPGPIGINMATYVGFTVAGIPGAVIATIGEVTPSIIVILIVAAMLTKFRNSKYVENAFYGLRPASSGLIGAACAGVVLQVLLRVTSTAVPDSLFMRFSWDGTVSWMGLALAAVLAFCAVLPLLFQQSRSIETGSWGLSFRTEGQPPAGNASKEALRRYDAVYLGDETQKKLYLTFDAGYENGCTEPILEALAKHNVKAAFFVVGNYIEQNPELVRRMLREGHIVGNHTYHHYDMSKLSDEAAFNQELTSLETLYRETTGEDLPRYYRPPQGIYSEKNLEMAQKLGYRTVFWSLAYVDWYQDNQPTDEQAFSKLLPRIHPGAVVLLHSTSQTNARILDTLLSKWEEMGYSFGTLDELFA